MPNLKTRIREAYRAFVNPEEVIKCRAIRDALEAASKVVCSHAETLKNQRKAGM